MRALKRNLVLASSFCGAALVITLSREYDTLGLGSHPAEHCLREVVCDCGPPTPRPSPHHTGQAPKPRTPPGKRGQPPTEPCWVKWKPAPHGSRFGLSVSIQLGIFQGLFFKSAVSVLASSLNFEFPFQRTEYYFLERLLSQMALNSVILFCCCDLCCSFKSCYSNLSSFPAEKMVTT